MKFKVGDKVRIKEDLKKGVYNSISTTEKMMQYKGKIAKIKSISHLRFSEGYKLDIDDMMWAWSDDMLEPFETRFKKSDLKNGDIVTCRDARKRTIISKSLMDEGGHPIANLEMYDNELKAVLFVPELDIVKVERPVKYETVFERKEEILDETEKRYLTNVIRPFRHETEFIEKRTKIDDSSSCYLKIVLNNDIISLPYFKIDSMYKGMELDKKYSLKELGL